MFHYLCTDLFCDICVAALLSSCLVIFMPLSALRGGGESSEARERGSKEEGEQGSGGAREQRNGDSGGQASRLVG